MRGGEINLKNSAQIKSGFTLVELLVVIAIIAILAAVVFLIIQPIELTKRGRDANRLTDLANLQSAINVAVQDSAGVSALDILCKGSTAYPCTGSSVGGTRATDGTGWLKVNFSTVSIPTLPIDPITPNTAANHYAYCADNDTWEINTVLESDQQASKMTADGGDDLGNGGNPVYEVGSSLKLIGVVNGCTYQ